MREGSAWELKNVNLKQYIEYKLRVLKDFGIVLDYKQLEHMWSLKNEIQVDNFASDLYHKHFHMDEDYGRRIPNVAYGKRKNKKRVLP